MPRFSYIAKDKTGKKFSDVEECANKDELITRLQSKGLVVINVQPELRKVKARQKIPAAEFIHRHRHYRITPHDLSLFCRQLATLIGAGVTILEALNIILRQVSSRRLYSAICDLRRKMEEGLSLHEAMATNRSVFSELWINLVESGEASGNLAGVLSRLAGYLERKARFRSKIISALIYPVILMIVGMAALLFLTVKIIPSFATLFSGFNVKLPALTMMLIGASNFIRRFLPFVILGIIAAAFLVKGYISRPEGRKKYEGFLFSLPIFGDFFRDLVVERFSSEMTTLIESGVPILYALEISERSVGNLVMSEIIRNVKEGVRQGRSLSAPMEKSGFFEPMVVQMVNIGEEVGDLSGMFNKINSFYQESVETFLTRFTSMFEPIMLVVVGIIIGIMVVGMFLPIFQISQLGQY
jgi:type IV pilus assembly protein PilC